MKMSDIIEDFIKDMLSSGDGNIEIRRNELAEHFRCVPSQINYVISTRFTTENGYIVESRRGGGGFISIKRVGPINDNSIMHLINCIGDEIDFQSAQACIKNLWEYDIISQREANIMITAISDKILVCDRPLRDKIRAVMLKSMLLYLI